MCEGILITPQQQNFGGPVSCQVRLCSQQGPPISETNEQSGRWSRKETLEASVMGGVGGVGSLGLTVRSEESAELKGSGGKVGRRFHFLS